MEQNHVEHGDSLLVNRSLLNSFIDLHLPQLQLSGVPAVFYPTLFYKLQNQVYKQKKKQLIIRLLISYPIYCESFFMIRFSMPVHILVLWKLKMKMKMLFNVKFA